MGYPAHATAIAPSVFICGDTHLSPAQEGRCFVHCLLTVVVGLDGRGYASAFSRDE
jgi:hypothetical protein